MGALAAFIFFIIYIGIIVGVCALFVWICGRIGDSKGLPKSYKWFGLLGVIGIIIVAVINPPYPTYPQQYPPQYPQNSQNPYNPNQPNNTYFNNGQNMYPPQNPNMQQTPPPVNSNNGQQNISFCPNCGAPVDNFSVSCSCCGKMLR